MSNVYPFSSEQWKSRLRTCSERCKSGKFPSAAATQGVELSIGTVDCVFNEEDNCCPRPNDMMMDWLADWLTDRWTLASLDDMPHSDEQLKYESAPKIETAIQLWVAELWSEDKIL